MIKIQCKVAVINAGLAVPPVFSHSLQREVGDVLINASGRDIDLQIKPTSNAFAPWPQGAAVTALDLHVSLADLVGQPQRGPVNRIGILLADHYYHARDTLGVMFDRGQATEEDWNAAPQYTAVPREGCAVFLGAIGDLRGQSSPELNDEARFTAIHELGHIFNLQHLQPAASGPATYMARSRADRAYRRDETPFDADQCRWLSRCSSSTAVCPGGERFGDQDASAPEPRSHHNFLDTSTVSESASLFGVSLTIALDRHEFWRFEPLQLDVRLATFPGMMRRFAVPDMIDPGYEAFVLFIEEPTGERRRFRSDMHYCPHSRKLSIDSTNPFQRDVAIGQESGRLTFRRAGIHRLQAQLTLGPQRRLMSNVLEVNVLTERGTSREELLRDILLRGRAQTVLKRNQDLRDGKGLQLLRTLLLDAKPTPKIDALVRYALGRASLARRAGSPRQWSKEIQRLGCEHLERAIDSGQLGSHRNALARRWIEDSQQKISRR